LGRGGDTHRERGPPVIASGQIRSLVVGISPYLRSLRDRVGHELVLLPAVAVLPWDEDGRLLLVREAQTGLWQTVGGGIEPDEAPVDAAAREAAEEAGITIEIARLRTVVGGPRFRLTYPNGDLVSYVSIVFDVRVVAGEPRADGEETVAVAWFAPEELRAAELTDFTVALFDAIGLARP
jgi:8-oxo-dGTP pyrophosphatase MutT (NUDIX family)